MLKAVIFDLDGVVADSHPIHEAAWRALFWEQRLDPTRMNLDFLYAGHSRKDILAHYLGPLKPAEMERLGRRKDELYNAASVALDPKENVLRVLSELRAANILCALATSARRARAHQTLEGFGIAHFFAVVVTSEDVTASKPSPDIFLLAAEKLRVGPQECLVVEDSIAGVRGALAAGMTCIGFAPPERIDELQLVGAHELICDLPPEAPRYFDQLVRRRDSAGILSRGVPEMGERE